MPGRLHIDMPEAHDRRRRNESSAVKLSAVCSSSLTKRQTKITMTLGCIKARRKSYLFWRKWTIFWEPSTLPQASSMLLRLTRSG